MAMASGLDSQFGIVDEVTFGTAVPVTRFLPYKSESVKYDKERIESDVMIPGQRTANLWVAGKEGGGGDVEFDVIPAGFGLFVKHMLGTVVTSTPDSVGAPTVRLHTGKVGPLDGKSFTAQIGRPNNTGTVDPYTYAGCKINSWELACEAGGLLTGKISLDVASEATATALAVASYPAVTPLLSFANASTSITIAGVTYDVKKFSVAGDNGQSTDRHYLGSASKREQLEGAQRRNITGTVDLESYKGLTPYNLFKDGTEAALVATFSGALIATTFNYMVRVTMPRVRIDGETPNVGGPGLVDHALPLKALYSSAATTELQIEVQNVDVAA